MKVCFYITDKTRNMKFKIDCLCLFTLLLAEMVLSFPANYSSIRHKHGRQKRAVVENSQCKKDIEMKGMTLFNYGIDQLTMGAEKPNAGFLESLKTVYDILQTDRNATKWIIAEGLQRSFKQSHRSLLKNAKNANMLESALVRMYTEDHIYREMNAALAQHDCTDKKLTQADKDKAAYATALLATLLYWQNLPGYSKVTYRMIGGVPNIKEALKKYKLRSSVVFPAFSSSSNNLDASIAFAKEGTDANILLVIDNSQPSFWKPKDIAAFSFYPDESEFLYPSLAEFRVISKPLKKQSNDEQYYEIQLQLDGKKFKETLLQKFRRVCKF